MKTYIRPTFNSSSSLNRVSDTQQLLENTREFSLVDFCRVALHELKVSTQERIFVIAGLIELFDEIKSTSRLTDDKITIKDFTNFVVERIIDVSDHSTAVNN